MYCLTNSHDEMLAIPLCINIIIFHFTSQRHIMKFSLLEKDFSVLGGELSM